MATPREIIAHNLPSWLGLYRYPPTQMPKEGDLLSAADEIIAKLRAAGYVIEERRPGS